MRSALSFEILECILSHADEATLAAAARSSKALHDAAIRPLWQDIEGILPLMKLFPPEIIRYDVKMAPVDEDAEESDAEEYEVGFTLVRLTYLQGNGSSYACSHPTL
jgi:hypothetical protein